MKGQMAQHREENQEVATAFDIEGTLTRIKSWTHRNFGVDEPRLQDGSATFVGSYWLI